MFSHGAFCEGWNKIQMVYDKSFTEDFRKYKIVNRRIKGELITAIVHSQIHN